MRYSRARISHARLHKSGAGVGGGPDRTGAFQHATTGCSTRLWLQRSPWQVRHSALAGAPLGRADFARPLQADTAPAGQTRRAPSPHDSVDMDVSLSTAGQNPRWSGAGRIPLLSRRGPVICHRQMRQRLKAGLKMFRDHRNCEPKKFSENSENQSAEKVRNFRPTRVSPHVSV